MARPKRKMKEVVEIIHERGKKIGERLECGHILLIGSSHINRNTNAEYRHCHTCNGKHHDPKRTNQ